MTNPFSFNLLDKPWIPCLLHDGTPVELSLRDTLVQAHTLHMVADDAPHTTAALLRLLLAVMHRVFGPEDREAWLTLWTAERLDVAKLDAYFNQWRHRFDLFDPERPFYQYDDPRVKQKSVASLKYGVGFLHDQHFDHTSDNMGFTLSPAAAARALVTLHACGLGGLSGIPEKHVDAPCASGALFFVHGDTLMQTLLLNLLAYPEETFFPYTDAHDMPAWEQLAPNDAARSFPLGLLDYLTWQSRQPLLFPSLGENGESTVLEYKLGPGRRMASDVRDPYKVYRASKKAGYLALRFTEDKGLWRNSAALFNFDLTDTSVTRAPATLLWLAGLVQYLDDDTVLSKGKTYRCLALGLSKDRGKMLFARHESLPLLPDYLADPDLVARLTAALDYADLVARDLLYAARIAGMHLFAIVTPKTELKSLPKSARTEIENWVIHSGIERTFWAALDIPFQSFLVRLPTEGADAVLHWQKTLSDTAYAALEAIRAYTPGDARSLKALVFARRVLTSSLRRKLPQLFLHTDDDGASDLDELPQDTDDEIDSDEIDSDNAEE